MFPPRRRHRGRLSSACWQRDLWLLGVGLIEMRRIYKLWHNGSNGWKSNKRRERTKEKQKNTNSHTEEKAAVEIRAIRPLGGCFWKKKRPLIFVLEGKSIEWQADRSSSLTKARIRPEKQKRVDGVLWTRRSEEKCYVIFPPFLFGWSPSVAGNSERRPRHTNVYKNWEALEKPWLLTSCH